MIRAPGAQVAVPTGLADPLAAALGLVNWNHPWGLSASSQAPNSGVIYAVGLWLPFGQPVRHLATQIGTAASGTAITGGYMGLCSPTTMIAQTGNIGTAASAYPVGPLVAPLAGSVTSYAPNATDSPTGIYYLLLLLNGTFGTTQPAFVRGLTINGASPSGGSLIQFGNAGTTQLVLPTNGSAVTLSAASNVCNYDVGAAP